MIWRTRTALKFDLKGHSLILSWFIGLGKRLSAFVSESRDISHGLLCGLLRARISAV